MAWLTRYPLPNEIMVDRDKELLVEFKTMMANDFGMLCSPSVQQTNRPIKSGKGAPD